MKPLDCVVNLVVPRMLEEQVVDHFLEHPEWVRGFTTVAVEGHGEAMRRHGIVEEVRGRARRVLLQTVINHDDAQALIAHLRAVLPNPEIAWWITPVLGFGRFA